MHLLRDPEVWVTIGFILFVVLVFRRVKVLITTALDKRAADIARQIAEAEALRREAEAALTEAEKRRAALKDEAAKTMAEAQAGADKLINDGAAATTALLQRRRASTAEKIAQAEAEAMGDIRRRAAALALAAAREILVEQSAGPLGQRLLDQSIADLPARLA